MYTTSCTNKKKVPFYPEQIMSDPATGHMMIAPPGMTGHRITPELHAMKNDSEGVLES